MEQGLEPPERDELRRLLYKAATDGLERATESRLRQLLKRQGYDRHALSRRDLLRIAKGYRMAAASADRH